MHEVKELCRDDAYLKQCSGKVVEITEPNDFSNGH